MQIYDDFYGYSAGVYHRSSDNKQGWHIVLLVGWDDSDESWIAKNSWGTDWGMDGYVKLHRDERDCMFDNLSDLTSFSGTCFASHITTFAVTADEAYAPGESRDAGSLDAGGHVDSARPVDAASSLDARQADTNIVDSAVPDQALPDQALADSGGVLDSAAESDADSVPTMRDAGEATASQDAADSVDATGEAVGCDCQSAHYSGLWGLVALLALVRRNQKKKRAPSAKPRRGPTRGKRSRPGVISA